MKMYIYNVIQDEIKLYHGLKNILSSVIKKDTVCN